MLLTITTTHEPATDLGFLLHKHPDRAHDIHVPFGAARVLYPEASPQRCTAALLVDVDPVTLVRAGGGPRGRHGALEQYVNDRPYAASSFTSVAIGQAFTTALSGRSRERPELAATPIPLEAHLPVVPCRGGVDLLGRLFEPLGWEVEARPVPLDEHFPEWGPSPYLEVHLRGVLRVRDLLTHLYVLLPVLDDDKHYWVGEDEVGKLLRRGDPWLAAHPARGLIAHRYLRHDRRLAHDALDRLPADSTDGADGADGGGGTDSADAGEEAVKAPVPPGAAAGSVGRPSGEGAPTTLAAQRLDAVVDAVVRSGARSVIDLGCGEGKLVGRLLRDTQASVAGTDVSHRALEVAARRLHLDTMAPRQRERVTLFQGALTYRDDRLAGFDAATLVEVVEHLDPSRLPAFERAIWGHARPATVILTTPNREWNHLYPGLPPGAMRHGDHRFEWTRPELAAWAQGVAARHGYGVELGGIGASDPDAGQPTQLATFTRSGGQR